MEKYLLSVISALVAGVTVWFMIKYNLLQTTTQSQDIKNDFQVIYLRKANRLIILIGVLFGVTMLLVSAVWAFLDFDAALVMFVCAIFYLSALLLYKKSAQDNRIEYNSQEIRQFILFKKYPRILKMEELLRVEVEEKLYLLTLKSRNTTIDIDFRIKDIKKYIDFLNENLDQDLKKPLQKICK